MSLEEFPPSVTSSPVDTQLRTAKSGENLSTATTVALKSIDKINSKATSEAPHNYEANINTETSTLQKIFQIVKRFFSSNTSTEKSTTNSNPLEKLDQEKDAILSRIQELKNTANSLSNLNRALTWNDVDNASNLAKSTIQCLKDFDKLVNQYSKLMQQQPNLASLSLLQELTSISKKLEEEAKDYVLKPLEVFIGKFDQETQKKIHKKNPSFSQLKQFQVLGLSGIPKNSQISIIKTCFNRDPSANFKSCVDTNQKIPNPFNIDDDNTVQGGLGKDFNRTPPSHVFYSTSTNTKPQEIAVTQINQKKLAPLLNKQTACLKVIDYFDNKLSIEQSSLETLVKDFHFIANDTERLTNNLPLNTPEKIQAIQSELSQKKETILKTVSRTLDQALVAMTPIVGNSISYKEKIETTRFALNDLNTKLQLPDSKKVTTNVDIASKNNAISLLGKNGLGFNLGKNLQPAEEVAYELLRNFPHLDTDKKTALLQAIRSTSVAPSLKYLALFGLAKISEDAPHNVNVISNKQGSVLVNHEFTINLASTESVEKLLLYNAENPTSLKNWDNIPDRRVFKCKLTIDIQKGTVTQEIKEVPKIERYIEHMKAAVFATKKV